jgi:hypothetical protein
VHGVMTLERQSTFFVDMEGILADHIIMLEECFLGVDVDH